MRLVSFPLQLYARLNDVVKDESAGEEVNGERAPPPIRRTGLRGTRHGGGAGRQRRGGTARGTVSGRGRRPVVVVVSPHLVSFKCTFKGFAEGSTNSCSLGHFIISRFTRTHWKKSCVSS